MHRDCWHTFHVILCCLPHFQTVHFESKKIKRCLIKKSFSVSGRHTHSAPSSLSRFKELNEKEPVSTSTSSKSSYFFFLKRKLQNKREVGWLYRKWHAECPGTPPAPLHSRGIRPGPLAGQTASSANVCQRTWLLITPNSTHFPYFPPPYFPLPLTSTQKKWHILPIFLKSKKAQFKGVLPSLCRARSAEKSQVRLSKGTEAARSIVFQRRA